MVIFNYSLPIAKHRGGRIVDFYVNKSARTGILASERK